MLIGRLLLLTRGSSCKTREPELRNCTMFGWNLRARRFQFRGSELSLALRYGDVASDKSLFDHRRLELESKSVFCIAVCVCLEVSGAMAER